jgi:hypothetical protein
VARRATTLGLAVALLLAFSLPAAASGAQLPVGQADGVRVKREQGAIVVVFTRQAARLYRRVAGKRVTVSCTELPAEEELGPVSINTGEITLRAPERRRPLRTGDRTRGLDYCRVWLAARTVRRDGARTRRGRQHIVSVPLSQRGAVYLDEQFKAIALSTLLSLAGTEADRRNSPGYPTAPQLLELLDRLSGFRIVALASPADTPPPGAIGYFSDGLRHVAAVIVSASGRRLFIELQAEDVLYTNVSRYGSGELD